MSIVELYCSEFRRDISYSMRRLRGSGDWLLIYTAAGAGEIATERGKQTVQAGEALLYAPRELHDYRTSPAARKWHLLWVHFAPRPHWLPWLRWEPNAAGLRCIALHDDQVRNPFRAALRRMIAMSRRQIPGATEIAANALEEALLWARIAVRNDPWLRLDRRARQAVDYLLAHFREPLRIENVARHCCLSVSRLAHLFKQEIGISPQQFLEKHRMQQAAQLLRLTRLSIGEISAEVGYADPFYFANRFRRRTGKSPSQVRCGQE